MPISHDDIEPLLSNAQDAFRRGGQTAEEGLMFPVLTSFNSGKPVDFSPVPSGCSKTATSRSQ